MENTGIDELFEAVYSNDSEAIKDAVEKYQLDINATHPQGGHTPLMAACDSNSLDAISVLLRLGASVKKRFTNMSQIDGRVISRDSTVLNYVRSKEAAIILLKHGAELNEVDGDGKTPLVWGALDNNKDLVEFFIDAGADKEMHMCVGGETVTAHDLIQKKLEQISETIGGIRNEKQNAYIEELEGICEFLKP
jgi:ankyrin repeat protein